MYHEFHILSVPATQAAKILVPLVIAYKLVFCHKDKVGGINLFQRLTDNMTAKAVAQIHPELRDESSQHEDLTELD